MSPIAPVGDAGRVEAILVNHHGASELLGALESLPWHELAAVHVVDNSADAAQASLLRTGLAGRPTAQLHVAGENLGFGRACNLAWAHTRAEFVLLLNPDARLREGALARLRETLAASPAAAAVAPRMDWTEEGHLVLPNLTPQSPVFRITQAAACRAAAYFPQAFAARGARWARRTMRAMGGERVFEAPALSGAVLLLRRRAVLEAAAAWPEPTLFDPAYFMFFEDTDLSQRLRQAGWRLLVDPRARAWHRWHHNPGKAALAAQSERIYLQRHHRWGDRLQQALVPRLWTDPFRADARPVPAVCSAEECRQRIGPLLALTPLPMLHPAGVRADGVPRAVSDEEWQLLDPGRWYLWTATSDRASLWQRMDVLAAPG